MKHKISNLLLISLLLTNLPACIEVKDQDDEPKAMVQVIEGGDLKIEEPLYLIEGEFLRESEMQNPEKSQIPSRDYEYRFSSLEIGPKGVLYTMGNKVRIHAQTFRTWGGMIASFPEGQQSSVGEGRSGGNLMLWAQKTEGNLKVIMRGEQGKQGEPGDEPNESLKGFPGQRGTPIEHMGFDEGGSTYSLPGKGGPGNAGKKGFPGKQGYKGGNSGTFEFTSIQDLKFYLTLEVIPGEGGPGGIGGTGGEGGDGGPGANSASYNGKGKDFEKAKDGPPGDRGPQGHPGLAGTSGILETACVTVAGTMECKSESFNYSK
jgi:hypothetical protein